MSSGILPASAAIMFIAAIPLSGGVVFSENFEALVVSGYDNNTVPSSGKWIGSAGAYGADNRGHYNESFAWPATAPFTTPYGAQAYYLNYGGTGLTTWSGGAAFGTDTNNDGIANGIAWVIGAGTPHTNAIPLLPTIDNTSDPEFIIFTYRRKDEAHTAPSTTIAAQYGSTLTGWTNAVHDGTNIIITATNDIEPGIDSVQVKIKRTLAIDGKLFAHLNAVTSP